MQILGGGKIISFVPDPMLAAGAADTDEFNCHINPSAGTGLCVFPADIQFSTVGLVDDAGLWIHATGPVSDGIDVDPTFHPWLIFNEAIDPSTMRDSFVTVVDAAGTQVPAAVTFDYFNNALSIAPSSSLAYGSTYRVTVSQGFHSLGGKGLKFPYTWSFQTRTQRPQPDPGSPRPYIVGSAPTDFASAVPLNSTLKITFSGPMDPATIVAGNFHLRLWGDSTDIPIAVAYSSVLQQAILTPAQPLLAGATFTLDADAARLLNVVGNALQGNSSLIFASVSSTPSLPGADLDLPTGAIAPSNSGGGVGNPSQTKISLHYKWGDDDRGGTQGDAGCNVSVTYTKLDGGTVQETLTSASNGIQEKDQEIVAGGSFIFEPIFKQGSDSNTDHHEEGHTGFYLSANTPLSPAASNYLVFKQVDNQAPVYLGLLKNGPYFFASGTSTPDNPWSFSGPAEKALLIPLAIKRDGQFITGQLAKALPGDRINLSFNTDNLPAGMVPTKFEWFLPNTTFRDYQPTSQKARVDQMTDLLMPVDPNDPSQGMKDFLHNSTAAFYFADSGIKNITLKCELAGAPVEIKTSIVVDAPIAKLSTVIGSAVVKTYVRGDRILQLVPGGSKNPIDFTGNVTVPLGWPQGEWNWVQIVQSSGVTDYKKGILQWKVKGQLNQWAVDQVYPYSANKDDMYPNGFSYPTGSTEHRELDAPTEPLRTDVDVPVGSNVSRAL